MKPRLVWFGWILTLFGLSGLPGADDAGMERRPLFARDEARGWSPAECTVETVPARDGAPLGAWRWQVTVDHFAGEPKYPVGWPRIDRAIPEGSRDWSGWDFLRLRLRVETSREALPREPAGLGLHTPDRANAYQRPLRELRKDAWTEVVIPLSQIPRHTDVRRIQFHLAESNYRHGDRVEFLISDLELQRYAHPTLIAFAPANQVIFDDVRRLPLRLELAGVPVGQEVNVRSELRLNGRTLSQVEARVGRGEREISLRLPSQRLAPGSYDLVARVAGQARESHAEVRVVESPYP